MTEKGSVGGWWSITYRCSSSSESELTSNDVNVVFESFSTSLLPFIIHRFSNLPSSLHYTLIDPVLSIDYNIADRRVLWTLESEVTKIDLSRKVEEKEKASEKRRMKNGCSSKRLTRKRRKK